MNCIWAQLQLELEDSQTYDLEIIAQKRILHHAAKENCFIRVEKNYFIRMNPLNFFLCLFFCKLIELIQ